MPYYVNPFNYLQVNLLTGQYVSQPIYLYTCKLVYQLISWYICLYIGIFYIYLFKVTVTHLYIYSFIRIFSKPVNSLVCLAVCIYDRYKNE